MALAAGFSYGFVYHELVSTNPMETFEKISSNKTLFLSGLLGWLIIFIGDAVVSLSVYRVFTNTQKLAALITAWMRVLYTVTLAIAIYQLIGILTLLHDSNKALEVQTQITRFETIWSAELILFGLHLIGLGQLSLKSKFIPSIFAFLLYLAGASYLMVHTSKQLTLFTPAFRISAETSMAIPMALGELLLAVWLIYKSVKKNKKSELNKVIFIRNN